MSSFLASLFSISLEGVIVRNLCSGVSEDQALPLPSLGARASLSTSSEAGS